MVGSDDSPHPDLEEQQQEGQLPVSHLINVAFKSRFLLIEHFTVQEMGYGESYYAFVTFKNVEQLVEEAKLR